MATVAPETPVPDVLTTVPATVMVGGGFTVMVALAVRLPEVAVRVAVVADATLAGGVYAVVSPVAGSMLPGPLSAQDTVPVVLASVAVKLTGDPPAMTVELGGEMDSEGLFPPSPLLFPDPPPQARARQSNGTDASQRETDMWEPFVRFSTIRRQPRGRPTRWQPSEPFRALGPRDQRCQSAREYSPCVR
jgi:hypothetical protein